MGVKRSFISHGKKKKEKEKECCESDRTQKVRGNPRNREGFVTHIILEMKHDYFFPELYVMPARRQRWRERTIAG